MTLRFFIFGLELLILPQRAWKRISHEPYVPWKLALYTLLLSMGVFVFRGLGNWLLDLSFPWSLLEAALFWLICLGVVLSTGLILIPCGRFARRPVDDGHAMKLALFAATPIWLGSIFQAVPFGFVRAFFLLLTLAHASVLIFTGLPRVFGTEPVHTLVLSLLTAGVMVLGTTLLTQVFLNVAFSF